MLGSPKYQVGDAVRFKPLDDYVDGVVCNVNKWGCFWDDSDVHYDILISETNTIYKHIKETAMEDAKQ